MRFLVSLLALGALCLAQDYEEFQDTYYPVDELSPADPNLPDDVLSDHWNEARDLYKRSVWEQHINGTGQSNKRPRRGAKSTPFSDMYSEHSNVMEIYSHILAERHNISKRQAAGTNNPAMCTNPSTTQCSNFVNSRFRTLDGTCNNVNTPFWGAVNRPFNRLLQNAYDDGFNSPRGGFQTRLNNPRVISVNVHPDNSATLQQITNMVPQFGQFLDHDITFTPQANSPCCSNPNSNPADCWPIPVGGDAFFGQFTNCLDFTRSTPCQRNGQREQMNGITAFIDGSMIYSPDQQRSNNLRTFSGGMLRTNPSFQGFLPTGSSIGVQGVQGDFVAGDDRINEMPSLAVMHNVWLMEHNRIARQFQQISGWNDERIYQETRRIVIAEVQNVVYKEYLPIVLGPSTMSSYNLGASTWSTYDSTVDATITNEFSTAAYRFGHSMISGIVNMLNAQNQLVDSFQIATEYFQSRQITRNNGQGYDMILRGLMQQNSPQMDRFVTTGVTQFLFKSQSASFGSDLVSLNIQRGRDHGLRSYNDYRVACGGSDLSTASWSTVPSNIDASGWAQASKVYQRPSDIDLFVGGLIEIPISDGISGPTFTCIKATQFSRLKFGDRYFFTHNQAGTGFTGAQLTNLVARRLGDIICENSQQPDTQANVFRIPGSSNPTIPCGASSGRPTLNLNLYLP